MDESGTPPERWLPVTGYEGYYEVSDLGRVRSVDRVITRSDGKIRHWRGRVLRQYIDPRGYPCAGLSRDGIERNFPVHILVLTEFRGPCPAGQEARHGPAGKLDGSAANLCWGTRAQNMADKLRDGTWQGGERHAMARLTWRAVDEIRQRAAAGEMQRALAREYGVCFQNISLIVRGKTWARPA